MSHPVNNVILDGVADRLHALQEVLKPSAYAAFSGHIAHLIAKGEWELVDSELDAMVEAQDV